MAVNEGGEETRKRAGTNPEGDVAGQLADCRKSLRESEERFRSIFERAADGILIVGRQREILFVNPAAEALFGRGSDELLGSDFGHTLMSGDTVELDLVRRRGEEPVVAELRVVETTWAAEPAQLVTVRDITDRRRAEERSLRLAEERAARERAEQAHRRSRFLAEASAALDASLDAEATLGRLTRLLVPSMGDWCIIDLREEERIRRVAGHHADPDLQPLLQRLEQEYPLLPGSPQPAARAIESCQPLLLNGLGPERIRSLSLGEAHADVLLRLGARSAIAVPLLARGGCLGAITLVCATRELDVDDLRLAEEIAVRAGRAIENARLYQEALQASRAKSDFLAVISHELRTPLNAILGYTELMLAGVSDPQGEDSGEQLAKIRTAGRHLLQLIEEVLTFAQADAGRLKLRPEEVALGELVEEIAALAEPLARQKGLAFACQVESPEARLYTDAAKLRQIAAGLLSNAVKFTDEGGVELAAAAVNGSVVLRVRDTGPGIAPEDHERVFRPFWQSEQPLTRQAGGTGLGLSVARRLAEALGGTVELESTPGEGSVFSLRVPSRLSDEDPGPAPESSEAAEEEA
jgi:PAS domain S-box-containing protein